jgi:Matrixin
MRKLLPRISLLVLAMGGVKAADTTFWVSPCLTPRQGCIAADEDLARWALAAWEMASGGKLHFVETKSRDKATLRLIWATEEQGLYGETLGTIFDLRRGADIYVHNTVQGVTDALLRDTVVYLTCLHESGHALGLPHTSQFADIMYSFQFGGDIPEYFGRYRRKLTVREDIRNNSGISPADLQHLKDRLDK